MSDIIGRISSFAINQSLRTDVGRLQSNMYEMQDQLSSGNKSRNFAGLSGSVQLYVDLQSQVSKTKLYSQNIDIATTRLNTTNTSLSQIIQLGQDLKGLMTNWRSSDSDNINFNQQASQMQQGLGAALNVSMEGRYLFGGTRTDVQPVNTDFPEPVKVGVPDASYYNGSDQNTTFRAQDTYEFSYNVRADDPAFQNMFAALKLGMQAASEHSDSKMAQALDMLQKGISGVTALQTTTNVNVLGLKDIQDRHTSTIGYFQGLTDDVIKTDIVDVTTKLSYDQATLQAAYQAFSKMNGLRLADYLK